MVSKLNNLFVVHVIVGASCRVSLQSNIRFNLDDVLPQSVFERNVALPFSIWQLLDKQTLSKWISASSFNAFSQSLFEVGMACFHWDSEISLAIGRNDFNVHQRASNSHRCYTHHEYSHTTEVIWDGGRKVIWLHLSVDKTTLEFIYHWERTWGNTVCYIQ